MRYVVGFVCVIALGAMPLAGCGKTDPPGDCVDGKAGSCSNPPLRDGVDAGDKRTELINHIFGTPKLPATLPTESAATSPVGATSATVTKLTVATSDSQQGALNNYSYLHVPTSDATNRLAIVWQGHAGIDAIGVPEMTQMLLDAGVSVVVGGMPGHAGNDGPSNHDLYGDVKAFYEPPVAILNHLAPSYSSILMCGVSGGGATTLVTMGIDRRIDYGLAASGSMPLSIRGNYNLEREKSIVYQVAPPVTLYALASEGRGREHVQGLNAQDTCCYNEFTTIDYDGLVVNPIHAIASLNGGSFATFREDFAGHAIGPYTRQKIVDMITRDGTPQSHKR